MKETEEIEAVKHSIQALMEVQNNFYIAAKSLNSRLNRIERMIIDIYRILDSVEKEQREWNAGNAANTLQEK